MGNERKACHQGVIGENSQGAVSILLIFIVAVIFLFTSVLIDYARIAAAEWRAEVLAQSGIRSVMSAYEPALQQRYQLFAYGQSDPAQIMDEVTCDQAKLQATGVLSWVPLLLDSHATSITRELGCYDELERQILEDMKYKAPAQFTFELLDKLRPISAAMKEAAQTVEFLAKLQKLVDQRNKTIKHAFKLQKKLRDQAMSSGLDLIIANGEHDIMRDSLLGSIHRVADIGAQYADYVYKIQLDAQRTEDEDRQYEYETDNYKRVAQALSSTLQSKAFNFRDRHRTILTHVLSNIEKARQYDEDMKRVIQEIRSNSSSSYNSYDQVRDFSDVRAGSMDDAKQVSDTIKHIREFADDRILLPESFIADWQQEIELQESRMKRVDEAASDVQSIIEQTVGRSVTTASVSSSYHLKRSILNLWHTWDQYRMDFGHNSNLIDAREQRFEQCQVTEVERKKKEKEANAKLRKAANLLSKLKKLDKQLKEHQQLFQKVKDKAEAISNFNALVPKEESFASDRRAEAIDESKDAMKSITSVYDSLASGFSLLRDRLYRNEYAFLYFTSYDPRHLKLVFTAKGLAKESLQSFTIHNQEVEYMLYGFHNPVGNVSAAFSEIFATRLAIRTMEGLVKYARLGHPLLILAAATVYGIEQAIQDLMLLVTDGEIPVSRYVPSITLSYADHLRLFMLVHGNREGILMRMLALMQQNTGVDPTARGTYGETELQVSTSLWFLPGMIRWLGQLGLLGGEVEDGRYCIKKKSVFSYS